MKHLKNMDDPLFEGEEKKEPKRYGCVMLYLNVPGWNGVIESIEEEDLYEETEGKHPGGFGREDKPHVTVLFGLHDDIPDSDIEEAIKEMTAPEITLKKKSLFENDDFDVVKFDVQGDELFEMNKLFSKFPHTTDYPDYHPHTTVAYVLPGKGKKYIGELDEAITLRPNKIVYSKANREKKEYEFKK